MRAFCLLVLAVVMGCGPAAEGGPVQGNSGGSSDEGAVAGEDGEAEVVSGTETQVPQGFQDLLRSPGGRYSKSGWNHYGPGYFELDPETGVLTSHGGMGLFWYSVREFSDVVVDLEFKCASAETNSGVFLRVPGVPTSDDYIYHSFEVQISDAGEGIHQTGAAYDAEAPTHLASLPPGEWNHMRISFVGARLEVELNGEKVLDWEAEARGKVEDFAPSGYLGLQNHDDRSPVQFRNVYVKEVG